MGFFSTKQNRQGQTMTPEQAMRRLESDVPGAVHQTQYQIPENLMGNYQGMVMHLLNSGQVNGQLKKMIMPSVNRLLGK